MTTQEIDTLTLKNFLIEAMRKPEFILSDGILQKAGEIPGLEALSRDQLKQTLVKHFTNTISTGSTSNRQGENLPTTGNFSIEVAGTLLNTTMLEITPYYASTHKLLDNLTLELVKEAIVQEELCSHGPVISKREGASVLQFSANTKSLIRKLDEHTAVKRGGSELSEEGLIITSPPSGAAEDPSAVRPFPPRSQVLGVD